MKHKLLIAFLVALAASSTFRAAEKPSWAPQVDTVFASFDRSDSPGCALGVFEDGAIAYEHGYGMADLEHDVRITPETMFYAGSVSKQFTAMAVALAIQQGSFKLDDDVRRFIPELPDYGTPITVRHLVHHTSGIRDVNTLLSLAGHRDEEAFDNDAVLRVVARQKALNFRPGEEHLYSNSGYALLALIVERSSGKRFADFAQAAIFAPLGMKASHFHTDLGRLVPNRAFGYERAAGGGVRLDTPQNERAGAGGLFTNVRELLAWDENFYTARVGGPETIAALETPGRLNSGATSGYAWGLQPAVYRGLAVVEHGGALGGYRAHLMRFRSQHLSIAVLCNVSRAAASELSRRVADLVLADTFREPVIPRFPPPVPPGGVSTSHPPSPVEIASLAGTYESEELASTYRITAEEGELRVRRGYEKQWLSLQPVRADEFRGTGMTVRFRRNGKSAVTGFTLDAGRVRGIEFTRR
jgi:CubicO group peptidase (beta-lactamase class C family)